MCLIGKLQDSLQGVARLNGNRLLEGYLNSKGLSGDIAHDNRVTLFTS
jgi:hypothetical protein